MQAVYFQHEKLGEIFVNGNPIPNPIDSSNIRIYDGSTNKCATDCNNKPSYFYIDPTLSIRQFLCCSCLDKIQQHRSSIIREVDITFQELVLSSDAPETKNYASDRANEYDEVSCAGIYDPDQKEDTGEDAAQPMYYVMMPAITNPNILYIMSYDELIGSSVDDNCMDLEQSDLSDDYEYKYRGIWFRLLDEFVLM